MSQWESQCQSILGIQIKKIDAKRQESSFGGKVKRSCRPNSKQQKASSWLLRFFECRRSIDRSIDRLRVARKQEQRHHLKSTGILGRSYS
jgi:hypothetical protein